MADIESAFERMRVVATGSIEGKATATQCPTQACSFVNFIADTGNTGTVDVGIASTTTLSSNATLTTAGLQLTAKAQSGWLPCTNLHNFYYICSSTVDWATYVCVG